MSDTLNDNQYSEIHNNFPSKDGLVSLREAAKKYGYSSDHLRRLIRTGRIQAARYGSKGNWYVDDASLAVYHRTTNQNRFPKVPPVLSESSLNAEVRRDVIQTPNQSAGADATGQASHRGTNAIPKNLLLFVGGILFLFALHQGIFKIGVDTQVLKTKSADLLNQVDQTTADILDPLRNFVRKYLLPDYGQETYLVVDPYKLRDEKIKEQGERISALENQIFNFQFSIFNQAPLLRQGYGGQAITNDQTKKTTIIKEVTVGPSGTTLTLLEQRLDNTVSLIEATRINLSNLAGDFTNFQRITPTTIQLPSTNTKGVGPLTLNPDTLDAKTLKISGGTTLEGGAALNSTLSVVSDLTVDTNTFYVDATNNRVGIGTTSPETTFELIGIASISGDVSIGGTLTALGNIGIGTTSAPNELTVIGSGSFTGQLKATRNPTVAHTGTWPSFTNTNDSTLYINPSSPVADGNVIAYVSGSDPKFLVDSEGDIYGNNLILQGSTSTGTTTIAGDLSVEGNSTFGDASTDKIKFRAPILPYSLSSIPLVVKASASQTEDVFRVRDSSDNVLLTIDQGTGLLTASSGFNFALGNSTATVSYSRLGTANKGYSSDISQFNDLLISGGLEVDGNAFFDSKASISGNLQISGRFIADTAASHSFTGDLTISKEFVSSGTASNSFAGSLLISKGLNAQAIVGTGLTINGSITTTGGYTQSGTLNNTLTGKLFGVNSEFQGTASASYLLTGNTLQVGGYSSQSYSRFGTGTTSHANYISTTNDLLISGDIEVIGTGSFAYASASAYFGLAFNFANDCLSSSFIQWTRSTGKFGCAAAGMTIGSPVTDGTAGSVLFVDGSGNLGQNNSNFYWDNTNVRLGIGTTGPSTKFEVQGTASASYLLTGNTLQVGGYSSAAYSRFGTDTTGYASDLDTINDLLISGALEVNGNAFFDGVASVSGNFFTYGTNTFSGTGSSSFAGSLLISKGLNAQAIVGTALTVNGNTFTTGTL